MPVPESSKSNTGRKPGASPRKWSAALVALLSVAGITVAVVSQAKPPAAPRAATPIGDQFGTPTKPVPTGRPKTAAPKSASPSVESAEHQQAERIIDNSTLSSLAVSSVAATCEGDPTYKTYNGAEIYMDTTSAMTVDGDLSTFWRCAQKVGNYRSGYARSQPAAVGQTITIALRNPAVLSEIGLVNGWPEYDPAAKSGRGANRYRENGRITRVRVRQLHNGTVVAAQTVTLAQVPDSRVPLIGDTIDPSDWVQWAALDDSVVTDRVAVDILGIARGSSRHLGSTAALAEVELRGWSE